MLRKTEYFGTEVGRKPQINLDKNDRKSDGRGG